MGIPRPLFLFHFHVLNRILPVEGLLYEHPSVSVDDGKRCPSMGSR
ncbi:MAG: hypothetical protein GF316_21420 [Candidatus Lokiarchaeota archaeon]|nr:hypothetical protein [Candidatus Lokiarchaeota archaeon]